MVKRPDSQSRGSGLFLCTSGIVMPGQRTTDIQLPLGPGETKDPSIPGRAQRQADLALQRGSKAYETPRPTAGDRDATSLNPLTRLASKVRAASNRSMSRSR